MPLANTKPGWNWVSEYQVSGIPWVTSSTVVGVKRHDFITVTKFITVKNISGPGAIRVGFTLSGTQGSNYYPLSTGESFSGDFRVTSIFLSASADTSYTIVAGMTSIDARQMPVITGSVNGTGSFDGVG